MYSVDSKVDQVINPWRIRWTNLAGVAKSSQQPNGIFLHWSAISDVDNTYLAFQNYRTWWPILSIPASKGHLATDE